MFHERFVVEGDPADLVERLTVTEDDIELAGLILRGREFLGDRSDEGLPRGRLGRLAPTAQGRGDAGDDLGLAVRHGGGVREKLVERRGVFVGAFGDPPGDKLGDLRDAADVGAVDEVRRRQLAEAGPDEQRKVMVGGVLVEAQEVLGDERAHGDAEMRERRGEGETHALAAGLAREPEQGGFLFLARCDETGVVRELGQRVVPADQRLGELALDQAREDVLTLLGEDSRDAVMLGVLGGERLVA